jgi:hypothetical protein
MPVKFDTKYYKLDEAALKIGGGCTEATLIHQGAIGAIPIYISASEWLVDSKQWELVDTLDEDGAVLRNFVCVEDRSVGPRKLSGYLRLDPKTLAKFEYNPAAKVLKFHVKDKDAHGNEQLSEYWFDPELSSQEAETNAIKRESLLLAAESIHAPALLSPVAPKALSTKERDTLLKLVIGMAIGGYGYSPAASKNEATGEIASDLAKFGLSLDPDTVKKWLKEGAKLLPSKPVEN